MTPTWENPERRILNALKHVRKDAVQKEEYDYDIRIMLIEAVAERSQYVVEGVTIGATGPTTSIRAGDKWPVVYHGGRPQVVLAHAARRAQFATVETLSTVGIVEELFIATDPTITAGSQVDVYFRNYGQITRLKVTEQLPSNPLRVFWGVNNDVFAVLTGPNINTADTYHVFRIVRGKPDESGNQPLNKVISTSNTVKLKEKLYSTTLSTAISLDLTALRVNFDRNSDEGVAHLEWAPLGLFPACMFNAGNIFLDRVNHNEAHVSRAVTIHLAGTSTLTYISNTPGVAASDFVDFGKAATLLPRARLFGITLDANNDLIASILIEFNNFNIIQGNPTTGLTGSYSLVGDGVYINAGVCFVGSCPHRADPLPMQDFMDHGNPGGVVTTQTSETHAVLVNARTGAKIFSTFKDTVTFDVIESTQGETPYAQTFFSGMPVVPFQCYAQDLRQLPGIGITVLPAANFGNIGAVGITQKPRSLFDPAIAFNPDGVPRQAQIVTPLVSVGYNQEFTDGFQRVCGVFSGCSPAAQEIRWTTDASEVRPRYNVHVTMMPFYATTEGVLCFTVVVRDAQRPPGFTTDPHQVGVFITRNSAVLSTILPYTTIESSTDFIPTYLAHIGVGNDVRVFWRLSGSTTWLMSDFQHDLLKSVGSDATVTDTLALTAPDFLYAAAESKLYFGKGWDRKTHELTLTQTPKNFPPREAALKDLGALIGLPKKLTQIISKHVHTINDPSLVPRSVSTPT